MKTIHNAISKSLLVFVFTMTLFGCCFAGKTNSKLEQQHPVMFVDQINYDANKQHSTKVQDTAFDTVNSQTNRITEDPKMTISNTIGYFIDNLHHYLQYVAFAGLALATIFLIINGLKFVTKGEAHMKDFKKNIIYVVIGVGLLVAFYYIIDVFTSVANMLLEK